MTQLFVKKAGLLNRLLWKNLSKKTCREDVSVKLQEVQKAIAWRRMNRKRAQLNAVEAV